jgi:hypothetical protein
MRKSTLADNELPEVNFSEEGGIRHLHCRLSASIEENRAVRVGRTR